MCHHKTYWPQMSGALLNQACVRLFVLIPPCCESKWRAGKGVGSQSSDGPRRDDALQVIIVLVIRVIGIPIIPRMLTQKLFVFCKPPQVLRVDLPSAR